jgi:hypothetical protein
MSSTATETPFADSAEKYRAAGWAAVLPLPPREKTYPPKGFTGRDGRTPSPDEATEWVRTRADGNVALRLPPGVIGIDVDDYAEKRGAATLDELIASHGPLPATVRSTSRDGGQSGIYMYRVPVGLSWPREAGPDVDVVQSTHRYVVVFPSIHPEGRRYRWVGPDGGEVEIPKPDDLPALPEAWVEALKREARRRADVDEWLLGLPEGEPSAEVSEALQAYAVDIDAGAGREAMLTVTRSLARAGANGAHGVPGAIATARTAYEVARPHRDAGDDFDRALAGSIPVWTKVPSDDLSFEAPALDPEETFWISRPELTTIRTFALARMVSPWSVLGAILTDVVSTVPPNVTLPPTVGGRGSLNLFVGLVGPSGSGKGSAQAVAAEVLGYADLPPIYSVGSGEGTLKAYVRTERVKDEDGRAAVEIVQHNDRARMRVDEIDTLAALTNRSGATILPELRKAWAGESLGFLNSSDERRLSVAQHGYRLTLIAGIQPGRSRVLLDDADGGTPQRFVWLPSTDRRVTDDELAEPPALRWTPLRYGDHGRDLRIPEVARRQIRAARAASARGESGALDGHALLTRLKVAAALATLARRLEVTEDDWRLGGLVMAISDKTRQTCIDALSSTAAEASKRRGHAEAVTELAKVEVLDTAKVQRAAAGVEKHLVKVGSSTIGAVRRTLRVELRELLDEAVEALVLTGRIEVDGDRLRLRQ